MSQPAISVIMPVYNRPAMVARAIDSILAQSFEDFEFIIVDDGSSGETVALLADAARRDARIRLLTLPINGGQSLARALGHNAARGRYIAVMDTDDRAHPERLQQQYAFMEANPGVTLCGSRAIRVHSGGRHLMPMATADGELKARLLFVDRTFVHPSVIMRRDFLLEHHLNYGAERRGDDDYEFYNRLVAHGARFANLEAPLLEYHNHPDNTSANTPDMAARKQPLREFLLGLYYPDLTRREIVALAHLLGGGQRISRKMAWAGLLAAEKASEMRQSRYGEDHGVINAIFQQAVEGVQQRLSELSGAGP